MGSDSLTALKAGMDSTAAAAQRALTAAMNCWWLAIPLLIIIVLIIVAFFPFWSRWYRVRTAATLVLAALGWPAGKLIAERFDFTIDVPGPSKESMIVVGVAAALLLLTDLIVARAEALSLERELRDFNAAFEAFPETIDGTSVRVAAQKHGMSEARLQALMGVILRWEKIRSEKT